jgi:single-strand DNA-binding protein
MNKHVQVSMTGFVATNPVYSVSDKGNPYIYFRLAHSFAHYDRTRDTWIEDPTLWFTVKAWRNLATNLNKSLKKGDVVYVSGGLKQENWESVEQGKKSTTLIVEANLVTHDLTRGSSTFVRNTDGAIFDAEESDDNADDPNLKISAPSAEKTELEEVELDLTPVNEVSENVA